MALFLEHPTSAPGSGGETEEENPMKKVKSDRNMWLYLILTMLTCGIYSLFFMKKLEEDVNTMCKGDGQVTMNYWLAFLLGIVTCGIWTYVWLYQVCNRVYNAGARYGVQTGCSGSTYLLWTLVGSLICVGPFVAMHKQFSDLNNVGTAYNNTLGRAA